MVTKEAFVNMIQEHQRLINSLCSVYFQTEDDRKDARQDIILQLWQAFPSFRQEAKVSTWIYRVALNTILTKTKKDKWWRFTEALPETGIIQAPFSAFSDDEVQQLQQAIQLLHDIDKAIVILYLEGYSHKEIAATIRLSETNISTRFSRIKTKLQQIYKSQNYELR